MAEKGIIIDVGFAPQWKDFLDEIDKELSKLDLDKYLNLDEAFNKQAKNVRKKLKELKVEIDQVINGVGLDPIKAFNDLNKSMKSLQGVVLNMAKTMPDGTKYAHEINSITGAIDKLENEAQGVTNVLEELNSASTNKLQFKDQLKQIDELFGKLNAIYNFINNKTDKGRNKTNGHPFTLDDQDELFSEMSANYQEYVNLMDQIYDSTRKLESATEEESKEILKHLDQLYVEYGNRIKLIIQDYNNIIRLHIPLDIDIGGATPTDIINDIEDQIRPINDYINAAKIRLQKEFEELGGTYNLQEQHSRRVSNQEKIKVPVGIDEKSKNQLLVDVKNLIKSTQEKLTEPILVEVQLVSAYQSRGNQALLSQIQQEINNIQDGEVTEKLRGLIDKMNKRVENAMIFNIHINTQNATNQIRHFTKEIKEEVKDLQRLLTINPEFEITPEARQQLINTITEVKSLYKLTIDTDFDFINEDYLNSEESNTQALYNVLNNIVQVIQEKTQSFKEEETTVHEVVNKEIQQLKRLRDWIKKITDILKNQAEEFQNIDKLLKQDNPNIDIKINITNKSELEKYIQNLHQQIKDLYSVTDLEIWKNKYIEVLKEIQLNLPKNLLSNLLFNNGNSLSDLVSMIISDYNFADNMSIENSNPNRTEAKYQLNSIVDFLKNIAQDQIDEKSLETFYNKISSLLTNITERAFIIGDNNKIVGFSSHDTPDSTIYPNIIAEDLKKKGIKSKIIGHSHGDDVVPQFSFDSDFENFLSNYLNYGTEKEIIVGLDNVQIVDTKGFIENALKKGISVEDFKKNNSELFNKTNSARLSSNFVKPVIEKYFPQYYDENVINTLESVLKSNKINVNNVDKLKDLIKDKNLGNFDVESLSGVIRGIQLYTIQQSAPKILSKLFSQHNFKSEDYTKYVHNLTLDEFKNQGAQLLDIPDEKFNQLQNTKEASTDLNQIINLLSQINQILGEDLNQTVSELLVKIEKLPEVFERVLLILSSIQQSPEVLSVIDEIIQIEKDIEKSRNKVKDLQEKDKNISSRQSNKKSTNDYINDEIKHQKELEKLLEEKKEKLEILSKQSALNFDNISSNSINEITQALHQLLKLGDSGDKLTNLLKALHTSLQDLSNNKSDEKIASFTQNLKEIQSAIQPLSTIKDNTFLSSIQDILSKGEELKTFAEILKSTKKELKNAKDVLNNQDKSDIGKLNLENYSDEIKQRALNNIPDLNYQLMSQSLEATAEGLVKVTTLIKTANGEYVKYIHTSTDGEEIRQEKIESGTASILKQAQAIEKINAKTKDSQVLKKIGEINIEPNTPEWAQLVNLIKSFGIELSDVTRIIQTIDELGYESFQVFHGNGLRTTLGMNSETILYEKNNLVDLTETTKEFESILKKLPSETKKAFKDDGLATGSFVDDLERILELYQKLINLSNSGMNVDLGKYQGQLEELSNTVNNIFKFNEKQFTDEFAKQFISARDQFNNIFDQVLKGTTDIDSLKEAIREVEKAFEGLKDKSNLLADPKAIANQLKTVRTELYKNGAMDKGYQVLLEQYRDELEEALKLYSEGREKEANLTKQRLAEIISGVMDVQGKIQESGKTGLTILNKIGQAIKTNFVQYVARYLSLQDIIRYIRTSVEEVKNLDTALTELRKVSDATTERLQVSLKKSAETAKELGNSIDYVINITSDWARLNKLGLPCGNTWAIILSNR